MSPVPTYPPRIAITFCPSVAWLRAEYKRQDWKAPGGQWLIERWLRIGPFFVDIRTIGPR